MGYVSTGMGDCFGVPLLSLMALRLPLVDRNPFGPGFIQDVYEPHSRTFRNDSLRYMTVVYSLRLHKTAQSMIWFRIFGIKLNLMF